MANDGNPFERVTTTYRRPRFVLEPAAIAWDAVAFRLHGEREAVACIPRRALAGFFADLDEGKLDTPIESFLASPASGRILSMSKQTSEPGLFDELASAGAIAAPERFPGRLRGFGRGGGTPADARRDKRARRPRRGPVNAAVAVVVVTVVATAAVVFAVTRGGDDSTKVATAPAVVTTTIGAGAPAPVPDACDGAFTDVSSNPDGNPTGWTSTGRAPVQATAPSGEVFLGASEASEEQFGKEAVSLTVSGLAAAAGKTPCAVRISFRLYIIWSWDGNTVFEDDGEIIGPDNFTVDVNGGRPLLSATFANYDGDDQTHCPGVSAPCPGTTGSIGEDTLGYPEFFDATNTVYDLVFEIPHTADTIVLNFIGSAHQDPDDESWGLDNIVVGVR